MRLLLLTGLLFSMGLAGATLVQAQEEPFAATIRGNVLDEAGTPVPGARVSAGVYTLTEVTPPDAAGRFEVRFGGGYPAGSEVHLFVSAPGFVRAHVKAIVGADDVRAVLERGASVRGTLAAVPAGKLPEARVVRVQCGSQEQTVTARGGRFETSGMPPGEEQRVTVRIDDFVPFVLANLRLEKDATLDLGTLTLDRGATLELAARDAFGEPVLGAYVEVRGVNPSHLTWGTHTGADGIAHVRGLPRGTQFEVAASPPEGFGRSVSVERVERELVIGETDPRIEVLLQRPVVLRGRFEWAGAGRAPWLDVERLEVVATAASAEERWTHTGAVPGRGVPLGELEEVEFALWARPGTWEIALSVYPPGRDAEFVARLEGVAVPVPARGEFSGELDLGVVRLSRQ